MTDKQPIIIQRGSFTCTLFEVENLMALPLANVRKLWKIMFSDTCENRDTIQKISEWLPSFVKGCAERIPLAEAELKAAKTVAVQEHSKHACMGDGYWAKQVADRKAALKKATAFAKTVGNPAAYQWAQNEVEKATNALKNAKTQKDAPKLADRAVKSAQVTVSSAKAEHERAKKLQTIFNDLSNI